MQEIIQHINRLMPVHIFRSSLGLDYVIKWLGCAFNCVVLLEKTDTDLVFVNL